MEGSSKAMPISKIQCAAHKCTRKAWYAPKIGQEAVTCRLHRLSESWYNVVAALCKGQEEDGLPCHSKPSFAPTGTRNAQWCKRHCPAGVSTVDVRTKTCIHEGCSKGAGYKNSPAGRRLYCSEHATSRMCHYGTLCGSCNLFNVHHKGDICAVCRKQHVRSREFAVVTYLINEARGDLGLPARTNCAVHGGCSRYRPDVMYNYGTHAVVVEVDEDQHAQYTPACEHARMVQIQKDVGLPTVFVRFNPDKFSVKGVQVHVRSDERLHRLHRLLVGLRRQHVLPSPLTILYMFYTDGGARMLVPRPAPISAVATKRSRGQSSSWHPPQSQSPSSSSLPTSQADRVA